MTSLSTAEPVVVPSLGNTKAVATIAVKDIGAARNFYLGVLGLEPIGADQPGVLSLASGSAMVLVYESEYAGSNQATSATWILDRAAGEGIAAVVARLRDKGVRFEHYDFPGGKREGDVHVFGKIRNAWFKDPDGNILSIVSEE